MLRLFRVLLVIAIVLALGAGAAMFLLPVDSYRARIESAVLEATGRQLHIDGPVRLTFMPSPALDLGGIRLDGPPGAGAETLRAANATATLEFLPLLGGSVRVSNLTLTGADIVLERTAASAPREAAGKAVSPLRLGGVHLLESRIHLKNAARDIAFGADDLRLSWPRDGTALAASGMVSLGGESFRVDAATDKPSALFEGDGKLPLKFEFEGGLGKGMLQGDIDLGAMAFDGLINLTTPSARRILSLYGVTVPGDRGLHSLSLAATLRAQPGQAHLRNAKFTLDASTGSGAFGLKLDRGRLTIAGTLSVDQVDMASYAAFEEPVDTAGANGWSEAAVDLSGLREMDLDLLINARRATVADIAMTGIDAEIVSKDAIATLSITRATAYAGAVAGRLTADASGATPILTMDVTVSGFDAKSLFGAALGSEALAGRGDLTIRLASQGTSEAELVRALDGAVVLKLIDGALDGIDLSAVARTISGPRGVQGTNEEDATDIKSLSASFDVTDGLVRIDELALIAPFLRLEAEGVAGLPARAIRFRLIPRFVNDVYGQPGAVEGDAFAVPFAALGPWHAPSFVPDWEALRDMVESGSVAAGDLAKLPEPSRTWFAGVIANRTPLPGLPAVPGVADPPPPAAPAAP